MSHPPSGPPQPVQRPVAALSAHPIIATHPPVPPYPHSFPPAFTWGHPYPAHPPFHYGYPTYPAQPPSSIPTTRTQAPAPPPVTQAPYASVSAVFSEYADLYSPVYYDLPGADYSQTAPSSSQITELDTPLPVDTTSVAAMTFSGSSSSDSRLVLSVMLLLGKRLIPARALIDSGSGGDFINSSFVEEHSLPLSPR